LERGRDGGHHEVHHHRVDAFDFVLSAGFHCTIIFSSAVASFIIVEEEEEKVLLGGVAEERTTSQKHDFQERIGFGLLAFADDCS